uniref:Bromo domain-containing protein n=1 Tax=Amphimedon queenslandica TaxID=400682 RepID=A0A1X7TLY5_AMPQE
MTHYSLRGLQTEDSATATSVSNTNNNKGTSGKEEMEAKEEEQGEDEEGEEEEEEEVGGEEEEEEEEEEDEETGYYNLRKRRPVVYQYQPVIQVVEESPHKKQKNKRRKHSFSYHRSTGNGPSAYQVQRHRPSTLRHKTHQGSSTSSSDEDSDEARFKRRKKRSMKRSRSECLPMNFTQDDITTGPTRDRVAIGASLADINPMTIDRDTNFNSIGGLTGHIRSLKEMIVFPLLYPEVFETFHISPPRGVLFHGPPGCGKTLVARALANECSKEGRKVAFFMRKGADCLSKWVGESERQLRLLFDQAYQMRPSIIFFDEIDGLAPVRSTRQDQIHSSIVSTLLALMDGLDSRGEIVVIGATNRIDAIDPALRRPGRFDREFRFPLPSREDRLSILQIHTHHWSPPLKLSFLQELADQTVGYCGADLKSLCTEAALHSLRSHYPQIYNSSEKLLIDTSTIKLSASNFSSALRSIVPTAQRSTASPAAPLSDIVLPLLCRQFEEVLNVLLYVFPPSWKGIGKTLPKLKRERERLKERERTIATAGEDGSMLMGSGIEEIDMSKCVTDSFSFQKSQLNDQISNVFFDLDDIAQPDHSHSDPAHNTCITEDEAPDGNVTSTSPGGGACLDFSSHPHSLPSVFRPRILLIGQPVLVLATADCDYGDIPPLLTELFSSHHSCITIHSPSVTERALFLHDILMKKPTDLPPTKPINSSEVQFAELPVAPAPPPKELTDEEIAILSKQRQAVLRELRVFLRDATNKLLAERKFKEFTKPVDIEEVPDYFDIIKCPMDLSSVMKKIDEHRYNVPKEWLNDIDLITCNALEYNPEHDPDSRLLRHRAVALQDLAHSIFDHELSEDFEKQCNNMQDTFQRIGKGLPVPSPHEALTTHAVSHHLSSLSTPSGCISSNKLKLTSSTASNEPTRRSLRKMGINPESGGFPYYSPSKLRCGSNSSGATHPQDEEEESNEASRLNQDSAKTSTTDPKPTPVERSSEPGGDVGVQAVSRRLSFHGESSTKQSHGVTGDVLCNFNSYTPSLCSMSSHGETDTASNNLVLTIEEDRGREGNGMTQTVSLSPASQQELVVDNVRLSTLYDSVLEKTGGLSVDKLLQLHSHCSHIIFRHRMKADKTELLQDLEKCCDLFLRKNTSTQQ